MVMSIKTGLVICNELLSKINLLVAKGACILIILMFINLFLAQRNAPPESNGEYISLGIMIMLVAVFYFLLMLFFSLAAKRMSNAKWYKLLISFSLLIGIAVPIIFLLFSVNFGLF